MNTLKIFFYFLFLTLFMPKISLAQDWANTNYYKNANTKLGLPLLGEKRIVFMGNSITIGWKSYMPEFFEKRSYVNRGISGQTTPQMLERFKLDVLDLQPTLLIILAGINDIAENTGPITIEKTSENIISMANQAKENGIKVILSSVLPALDFPWRPGLYPANKVIHLNEILKKYAVQNNILYLDYFSSMVDKKNGLKSELTEDGVHPNKEGYLIMTELVEKAIDEVLSNY
jgi:lysophospholipase L1-like esterase